MVQQLHRLPLTSLRLRQALQRHDLAQLNFNETVALQYLPTHSLVQPSHPGHFVRTALYQHLPTPSIAEWVRQQPRHKQKSAILVSHVGLLLRQDFQYGQLIYPEVRCQPAHHSIKSKCWVVPHYCQQHKGCQKLMFSNATSKYPKHCFLTIHHGHYQIGQADTPHSFSCNRVVNVPLFTYLTEHMVGRPPLINNSKILGLHLETIQTVPAKTQQQHG